jgi:hypothetical protein
MDSGDAIDIPAANSGMNIFTQGLRFDSSLFQLGLHQIADRHYTHHLAVFDHRHVAEALGGHGDQGRR